MRLPMQACRFVWRLRIVGPKVPTSQPTGVFGPRLPSLGRSKSAGFVVPMHCDPRRGLRVI